MLLNNNPRNTAHCVDYLRNLAQEGTSYVHRESGNGDMAGTHPFEVADLDVWAPEENTAIYYGYFRPMALGVEGSVGGGNDDDTPPRLLMPRPPQGVDVGAFYRLVEWRRSGLVDNLMAIDKSKNNSGIVFSLEWQGWKLLFTADAELRSWKEMNKRHGLSPVHFLKISHHASHNGTPAGELVDKIFPPAPPDARDRVAVASTFPNTYSGIPDEATLERLEARGVTTYKVYEELGDESPNDDSSATATPVVGYVEFAFPAAGGEITARKKVLPDE
jgi:hypothetical protein